MPYYEREEINMFNKKAKQQKKVIEQRLYEVQMVMRDHKLLGRNSGPLWDSYRGRELALMDLLKDFEELGL